MTTWHVWGGYTADTGPFSVYAAPDDRARTDGLDWTADRAGLTHLGSIDNGATLTASGSDEDPAYQPAGDDAAVCGLCDAIIAVVPDDAKGWTGRGVAITYGPG